MATVNSSHILSDIGVWTLFASPFVFLCCFFSDSLNFHKRFLVLLADSWQWEVCVMHTLPFNANSKFTKNHHWHVGECLLDLCIRPPPQKKPPNISHILTLYVTILTLYVLFLICAVIWCNVLTHCGLPCHAFVCAAPFVSRKMHRWQLSYPWRKTLSRYRKWH